MNTIHTPKLRRVQLSAVAALVVFVVITTAVFAQTRATSTVTIGPSKDNTLYESSTGALSNGAGSYMFVGKTDNTNLIRRAVLAFDLSSIPSDATVNSASTTLNMSKTSSGSQTVSVHKLTADWGEGGSVAGGEQGGGTSSQSGDVTWIHRFFNSTSWASVGGDFSSTASASQTVTGNGKYTWTSTQLIADVQSWVSDKNSNFGWLLKGNESSNKTTKRFDTKENSSPSNRPVLTITYTLPTQQVPSVGLWGMILISGTVAVVVLMKVRDRAKDTTRA